jgi:hypothetical protein
VLLFGSIFFGKKIIDESERHLLLQAISVHGLWRRASYLSITLESSLSSSGYLLYYFNQFILSGLFFLVSFCVGAVPYGTSFSSDVKSGFLYFSLLRASKSAILGARIITVALSAFISVFVGYMLALLAFSAFIPMTDVAFNQYGWSGIAQPPLAAIIDTSPALFLVARITILSAACSFWAVLALFISTLLPNVFIIYASPIVVYYMSLFVPLPSFLSIPSMLQGTLDFGLPTMNAGVSFLYSIGFFVVLAAVFGLLFYRRAGKKLSNV